MDTAKPCEYCHQRPAVATCKLCGTQVCEEHDRDHGCAVCKGGAKLD